MSRLRVLVLVVVVAAGAVAVAAARADGGGPSPGLAYGGDGITGPARALRYVTLPTARGTLVEAVRVRDGHVMRWTELRQALAIPYVTNDGHTGGLSHDLRTLVLSSYSTSAVGAFTRFAAFDTRAFRVRRLVTLRGTYSFDAIAPDASTLYLIQYTSRQNWNRYRVRAYDLVHGRLLSGSIVDKREPAGQMTGWPLTRTTSSDERWVYTFYIRPGGTAFVHALDTRARAAVCIDLPWRVGPAALGSVTLAASPRSLTISQRRAGLLATVDLQSFTVHAVRAPLS